MKLNLPIGGHLGELYNIRLFHVYILINNNANKSKMRETELSSLKITFIMASSRALFS